MVAEIDHKNIYLITDSCLTIMVFNKMKQNDVGEVGRFCIGMCLFVNLLTYTGLCLPYTLNGIVTYIYSQIYIYSRHVSSLKYNVR